MNFKTGALVAAAALAAGLAAAALPPKLNLRERDKLLAELAAKEKQAEKQLQRAVAGYDRRRLEMLTCEDKDLAVQEKALEDFILKPGLGAADYVSFLYESVGNDYPLRRAECIRLADQAAMASTNQADHAAFYSGTVRKLEPGHWSWANNEEPEFSWETRLRYIERAERDPLMADKGMVTFWRHTCLKQLGRFDEAEKLLKEALEKAEDKSKGVWAERLAQYYTEQAYRFYATPDPATLRQALKQWEFKHALAQNGDGRARTEIISLLMQIEEWQEAKRWIAVDTSFQKDQKPSATGILNYGHIAFAEKHWAEAAEWYAQYPKEKCDWQTLHKMAQASHAAGDDAAALEYLKLARTKCSNRYEQPHLDFEITALESKP
jgi:tetratricopeptide (TPR) repeat protein